MRCDACGVESPLEAMFVRQRKSFRRGVHSLCPRCAKAGEDTVAALILILPGILLVLAFKIDMGGSAPTGSSTASGQSRAGSP